MIEPKKIINYPNIIVLTTPILIFIIIIIFGPILNEKLKIYHKPSIDVSVEPRTTNLTLEGNETVSKRIRFLFSEPVYLIKSKSDVLPNLDRRLDLKTNSTSKTAEHFIYIIINNSGDNIADGKYEGVLRSFYTDYQGGKMMNITIPLNIVIIKKPSLIEKVS